VSAASQGWLALHNHNLNKMQSNPLNPPVK